MASTLELVGKLKAQLAESRQDLFKKDAANGRPPKEASTVLAGSSSASICEISRENAPDYQEEIASLREEFRQHSSNLTAKMTSLAFSTRQLSQQLIREREDRLAFQQEVREGKVLLPVKTQPAPQLLESSMVALREDLEHLNGQFQGLQQEAEAALHSMALQLGSVVTWVQEKLEVPQHFMKDGICLSPILEGRGEDSPRQPAEASSREAEESPHMIEVLRNIADEMPPMMKQMAEKTQILVERLEEEHRDRLAREAQLAEGLKTLSHRVDGISGLKQGTLEARSMLSTLRVEVASQPMRCTSTPVLRLEPSRSLGQPIPRSDPEDLGMSTWKKVDFSS